MDTRKNRELTKAAIEKRGGACVGCPMRNQDSGDEGFWVEFPARNRIGCMPVKADTAKVRVDCSALPDDRWNRPNTKVSDHKHCRRYIRRCQAAPA